MMWRIAGPSWCGQARVFKGHGHGGDDEALAINNGAVAIKQYQMWVSHRVSFGAFFEEKGAVPINVDVRGNYWH